MTAADNERKMSLLHCTDLFNGKDDVSMFNSSGSQLMPSDGCLQVDAAPRRATPKSIKA
jgi:hypothetical protein